jgi:Ternary complex associated domain 9
MLIDYKKTVLLGDRDLERAALLIDIIRNDFCTQIVHVEFLDEVDTKVLEALQASNYWKVVLLATNLEESATKQEPIFPRDFSHIAKNNYSRVASIYTEKEPPDSDAVGLYVPSIYIPSIHAKDRRQFVIDSIVNARIGGLKWWKKPKIILDSEPVFLEQVGTLSSIGDIEKAKDILAYLIRDFINQGCDAVRVSGLIQGASGSKVFRFRPEGTDSEVNERVLKIAHYHEEWKLIAEVSRHREAQQTLGNEYKGHVPEIESLNAAIDPSSQHISSYEDWRAIAYDFLGGKKFRKRGNRFGKFMDLETALIGSHVELQRKSAKTPLAKYFATAKICDAGRRHFLEVLLDWLCNNWYIELGYLGEKQALWDYENGPDDRFEGVPPYKLPGRSKRWILNFLDGNKAKMGERLFVRWQEHHKIVRDFIAGNKATLERLFSLSEENSVMLSPSHGDLNSNNILLWLDEEHPFLIDFPLYQSGGHVLQDFARLEVEIKFILMDRQEDSRPGDLPAFDYTHSQVPLWQALEEHLLSDQWDVSEPKLPVGCFDRNVRFSYDLVTLVRTKAREVQRQKKAKVTMSFWDEYRIALLYHTLRAIGYDTLSPFKRLLAVFSAAELLAQCRTKES